MPFHPSFRYLPLFGALIAGAAAAQTPRYTFSGFGTIGLGVLDEADLEYRTLRAGGGADEGGSFELDTRLGLQLDVDIDPRARGDAAGGSRERARTTSRRSSSSGPSCAGSSTTR